MIITDIFNFFNLTNKKFNKKFSSYSTTNFSMYRNKIYFYCSIDIQNSSNKKLSRMILGFANS